MDLMMRVWKPAVARVQEEVAEMKPFAAKDGVTTIEPWDYRFYQEKVRKAKYDLSQERLSPISSSTISSKACSGRPSSCTT